jgi:hypothetical protein
MTRLYRLAAVFCLSTAFLFVTTLQASAQASTSTCTGSCGTYNEKGKPPCPAGSCTGCNCSVNTSDVCECI